MRARTVAGALAIGVLAAACSSSGSALPAGSPHVGSSQAAGVVASAGCRAASSPRLTNHAEYLDVGRKHRNYLLTTPPPQSRPMPLVVDFHGYGEGANTESLTSQFGALGQRDGFIVVFPNGTGSPVAWNTSTRPGNPDLRFVRELLDRLEATQCVDESRVYATGLSQGAFMTSAVACAMSDRFAAVAPVAGVQFPSPCPATRPVPILAFHGTADPILHFNGGIGGQVLADDLGVHPRPLPRLPRPRLNGPGYPAHIRAWAEKDGCRPAPEDSRPSPHVIHRAFRCPPGVAVQFDIVLGGGHTWPGSAFSKELVRFVGPTTTEITATDAIWSFFQRFRLNAG
jgi:polyhydroxybutyrate depolymerase